MSVILKNNSAIDFMIEDLGIIIQSENEYNTFNSIDQDELCESIHLKTAVKNNIISLVVNDVLLSIDDALKFLTIESALEDSNNEKWKYNPGVKAVIAEFTQLRIYNRPIELGDGVELILEEGSDLILE